MASIWTSHLFNASNLTSQFPCSKLQRVLECIWSTFLLFLLIHLWPTGAVSIAFREKLRRIKWHFHDPNSERKSPEMFPQIINLQTAPWSALKSAEYILCPLLQNNSSMKQGNLVQLLLCNFLIYKKGYPQILKIFIHTPKHHHDPFHTKK